MSPAKGCSCQAVPSGWIGGTEMKKTLPVVLIAVFALVVLGAPAPALAQRGGGHGGGGFHGGGGGFQGGGGFYGGGGVAGGGGDASRGGGFAGMRWGGRLGLGPGLGLAVLGLARIRVSVRIWLRPVVADGLLRAQL